MKKIILVSTAIFLSLVSNAQWQLTTGPTGAGHISAMTAKDSTVFAGTETGGVFVSTDNGDIWTASNNGLTNPNEVKAMVSDSTYVFAGIGNSLGGPAVFSSVDDAATWTPTPLQFMFFFSLAIKPTLLIAGTWDGVAVSTNHGTSWNSFTTGLPSNASVSSLAFAGNKIFAGISGSSVGGTGAFYSTNNGTSWNPFNTGWSSPIVNKLAVIDTTVFAGLGGGVYRSSVNTAGWTAANTGMTGGSVLSFHVVGNELFAGTASGIFQTNNNGTSWIDISTGLPANSNIYSITTDDTYIYAGADSAVYRRLKSEVISGIAENNSLHSTIGIYPNPTSAQFTLTLSNTQTTKEKYDVSIYNVVGEKMMQVFLNETNQMMVDMSSYPKGIYFVKAVSRSGESVTKKVVKM